MFVPARHPSSSSPLRTPPPASRAFRQPHQFPGGWESVADFAGGQALCIEKRITTSTVLGAPTVLFERLWRAWLRATELHQENHHDTKTVPVSSRMSRTACSLLTESVTSLTMESVMEHHGGPRHGQRGPSEHAGQTRGHAMGRVVKPPIDELRTLSKPYGDHIQSLKNTGSVAVPRGSMRIEWGLWKAQKHRAPNALQKARSGKACPRSLAKSAVIWRQDWMM